jgi:hypothetical protein
MTPSMPMSKIPMVRRNQTTTPEMNEDLLDDIDADKM